MTGIVYVVVFVLVLCYVTHVSSLHGSEFLCRDPDTGKFHPVHSTWSATTFCGNYTCKIRKKIRNESEYAPMREFKFHNIDLLGNHKEEETNYTNSNNKIVELKLSNQINTNDRFNQTDDSSSNDRLLTEEEIKTITHILHYVKKSDLDALIEIYKLAQEIYKDIDGQDETSTGKSYINTPKINTLYTRPYSYWYGPTKVASSYNNEDSKGQESNTVSIFKFDIPPFKQPLNWSEFKRLSYIYPVTDFQRSSSYTRPISVPIYSQTPPTKITKDTQDNGRPIQVPPQTYSRPPIYLPYPLSYIQQYNGTNLYAFLKYGSYANYKPNWKQYYSQIPNAVLINPYLSFDIKDVGGDTMKKFVKVDEDVAKVERKNSSSMPAWQTPPLTKEVLDDVRAHNQVKAKMLKPWKKSTRLERVVNVIQLEKIMRSKRDVLNIDRYIANATDSQNKLDKPAEQASSLNKDDLKEDNSLFELVIEKVMCSANYSTPGYFRHGDVSQPFPECCPQRIESR